MFLSRPNHLLELVLSLKSLSVAMACIPSLLGYSAFSFGVGWDRQSVGVQAPNHGSLPL